MSQRVRIPYTAMMPHLRTGDLLLCSGNTLFSRIVRLVTRSEWSHCGIVIRDEVRNELFIWESTTPTAVADVETGTPISGVQLVPMRERVLTYPGHVAVRRLEAKRTREMLVAFDDFRAESEGKPFDKDVIEMLRAAMDNDWTLVANQEDLARYFCSELVAEAYQRMGLLPDDPPSNEYTPRDFSTEEPGALRLPDGIGLSMEIGVDPD